jgi:hypothetical protein
MASDNPQWPFPAWYKPIPKHVMDDPVAYKEAVRQQDELWRADFESLRKRMHEAFDLLAERLNEIERNSRPKKSKRTRRG